MTNRMSITRELFPDHAAIDLYGNNTLSTSSFKEISPLDTSSTGSPSGKVYISSTSSEDDIGVLIPSTGYSNSFTITSTATVVSGPKNISLILDGSGTAGTNASITDGMSAEDIAGALRATTLAGYTITGSGAEVIVTFDTVGNQLETVSIFKDADVTFTQTNVEVQGTFAGGSAKDIGLYMIGVTNIVAGTMTVTFNDQLPVEEIVLAGTESASDIYNLIVAATPASHTSTIIGPVISIENNTPQSNTSRILIDAGDTLIDVTEITYQDGIDSSEVTGTGATSVEIKGVTTSGKIVKEIINTNGQTQVESMNSYDSVLSLMVKTTGSSNHNIGKIYVGSTGSTAGKPETGYLIAPAEYNRSVGTGYTVPSSCESWIEHIDFFNPTSSEIITIRIMSGNTVAKEFKVGAGQTSMEFDYPVKVEGKVSLVAKSTSTTPLVTANISGLLVKKV